MIETIPFVIPGKFQAAVASGAVRQVGALLKDTTTGRIVAHLQETGAMQQIASNLLGHDPVTAVAKVALDATNTAAALQANRKLAALTNMVGNLQTLQMVSAATSIIGVGVTMASTAVIIQRLKGITDGISQITEKIDSLPHAWRELEMEKTLDDVQTQLERLEEIGTRKSVGSTLEVAEEKLHTAFNRLHRGATTVIAEVAVNADLLRQILAGLALSGGAQIRALYEMDELVTAGKRAQFHFDKLQALSTVMPRDTLAEKLGHDTENASLLASTLSQIRLNTASQPSLAERLSSRGISGHGYLARVREEQKEPLLLLPLE